MNQQWHLFHGKPRQQHDVAELLKKSSPPWRNFRTSAHHRGQTYLASDAEVRLVNAALYLRRPLLVTGPPGSGKSSLAYAIAEELQLSPILKWPINSRSTLTEGLYHYDAIARLRDANLEKSGDERRSEDIRRYLRLQWLGTALASPRPRVLLIDEIDKADIDLPNDLLHVLEEGNFVIPELQREEKDEILVPTSEADTDERIKVVRGVVQCEVFPIIVITSNGERELPLAFHRRCLRLDIKEPDSTRLEAIVNEHLRDFLATKGDTQTRIRELIATFITLRQQGRVMANDQLLNLVYLLFQGNIKTDDAESKEVQALLFRGLDE